MTARALSVRALTHSYGGGAPAVDDVSFDVPAGEIAALLGPSGCGKSTVLRAIAGLIRPDRGTVSLGSTDLTVLSARARGIGMVFQNYALFPHLTVAENIAYPLACQHVPRAERRTRVAELLALIRLDGFGRRLPRELSGGQQQRVAVARALASRPSLLLLDEPFGALDRALRFDLQVEMLRLQKSLGITTLIVTHDQEEAQSLATRLVLMNRGRVEQIDSPTVVYDRPRTLFVNSFIGHASRLPGVVESSRSGEGAIRLSTGDVLLLSRELSFIPGAPVVVTCRPEDVRLLANPGPAAIEARLTVSVPLGPTLVHDLQLVDGTEIRATEMRGATGSPAVPGGRVYVQIDTDRCHVFPRDTGN
ncbi:ABC transporter ATP-binding protein [Inquilinus sp. Marseille-Q2685]|uniref:ABC transporter ATP-binding protein n=1 Tax=Inquilinus sp. Marseille-Q2685 TaxID=2866581 RepID=UPI001CE45993|nr:ABC transporter ATP-binding protein [Inquilinus sp. Marseille-Q2685]